MMSEVPEQVVIYLICWLSWFFMLFLINVNQLIINQTVFSLTTQYSSFISSCLLPSMVMLNLVI